MGRPGATATTHELLLDAVERAAEAQEDTVVLLAEQHALVTALRETCTRCAQRRRAIRAEREARRRAFGNGHRDAGKRSPAG